MVGVEPSPLMRLAAHHPTLTSSLSSIGTAYTDSGYVTSSVYPPVSSLSCGTVMLAFPI